ncbi:MAG: hypothetical protein LBU58_01010 [Clostridiales bacterium]|nr:hypothetical protein [Clostridiales bacterium]
MPQKIIAASSGPYHSLASDDSGNLYSWANLRRIPENNRKI